MNEPTPVAAEETLWSGSVSNLHYLGKWLLVLILVALLAASFLLTFPNSPQLLLLGRVTLVVLALIVVGWIQLDRSRRKYAVTNKRVSVEYGIVSRTSNEVRVQDIRSINLRQRGLSGLLGVGTVEFSSSATDDADVVFWNTPEAAKVRDLVRKLQS